MDKRDIQDKIEILKYPVHPVHPC